MLEGTRCLFQPSPNESHDDTVYLITESSIEVVNFWPSEYIIAFFDADGPSSQPAEFLLNHLFVKIIAACPPNNAFQRWIEKPVSPTWVTRRMTTPWSPQELFLTGMFLAPLDLSFSRLRELTTYFGFNPCRCFHAPLSIDRVMSETQDKIKGCSEKLSLEAFWYQTRSTKSISHSVFQLLPANGNERFLDNAEISAISPWALRTLLEIYEDGQAGASFEFYKTLDEGAIRRQMFQVQVLKHLGALKGREQFSIRRLTDSVSSQWTYPGPTASCFSHSSTFPRLLEDAVTQGKSIHLVPQEPNFPAFHSILYTPGDVLTVIHVTVQREHPVAVAGLQRIESWLKRASILSNLQPSILGNHWQLIFVVPEQIASTFQIQKLEGDTDSNEWFKKVDQYVLGINEDTFRSTQRCGTAGHIVASLGTLSYFTSKIAIIL